MKSSTNKGDNAGDAPLPGPNHRLRYVDVVELSHRDASASRRTPAQASQAAYPDWPGLRAAGIRVQPRLSQPAPVDSAAAAREEIANANREASKLGLGPRFFDTLEQTRIATPALLSDDARWVFAVRVRREIQGGAAAIVVPESRKRLLKLATRLGLRGFDANLIIAIVQDDARNYPSNIPVPSSAIKGPLALIRPASQESASDWLWWSIGASIGLAALGCILLAVWVVGP
ncbi:MAG: hypothetical protein U0573_15435 [Phycisphaerales bacterium]|nr:hypothetical protein [Planctomycetota bacterium]